MDGVSYTQPCTHTGNKCFSRLLFGCSPKRKASGSNLSTLFRDGAIDVAFGGLRKRWMKTTALPFTLNFKPVYCLLVVVPDLYLSEKEKINADVFTGLFTDPTLQLSYTHLFL